MRRLTGPLPDALGRPEDGDRQRASEPIGIDRQQLEAVYRIEAPRIRKFLKRKLWIEDDRNDLVQEAFIRLAESKSRGAAQNPGAYLQGIVRHLLADRARRWARARLHATAEVTIPPEPHGPDVAAEINQMRERYRAAVDTLPPKTREVYMLHRADELEYKQIAERLGISIRTVEWHVAQAIIRISKSIKADG